MSDGATGSAATSDAATSDAETSDAKPSRRVRFVVLGDSAALRRYAARKYGEERTLYYGEREPGEGRTGAAATFTSASAAVHAWVRQPRVEAHP